MVVQEECAHALFSLQWALTSAHGPSPVPMDPHQRPWTLTSTHGPSPMDPHQHPTSYVDCLLTTWELICFPGSVHLHTRQTVDVVLETIFCFFFAPIDLPLLQKWVAWGRSHIGISWAGAALCLCSYLSNLGWPSSTMWSLGLN